MLIFCQFVDTKNSVRALIVFQALFAGLKSFLGTIFELITNKAEQVELMMLYLIFSYKS